MIKKSYYMMSNYQEINENIYNYIRNKIRKNIVLLKYKDIGEKNIEYILDDNPKIKKIHNDLDKIICDLYNDTIEKINIQDFNNYQKNIKLFQVIVYDYNCNNLNLIQKDLLETLMQRVYELIRILIKNKKTNFAIDTLIFIEEKVEFTAQQKDLSNTSKKILVDIFNTHYFILELCSAIEKEYSFNSNHISGVERLIFEQQYTYLLYIEAYIDTSEYDRKRIISNVKMTFLAYINAIKNNKYFSEIEKKQALKTVLKCFDESSIESTWKNYMNYHSFQLVRKFHKNSDASVNCVNTKDKEYQKVNQEVKLIKEQIYSSLKNINKL